MELKRMERKNKASYSKIKPDFLTGNYNFISFGLPKGLNGTFFC